MASGGDHNDANTGGTLPGTARPGAVQPQRHIVDRLGPLPISPREIHIVPDALGPLLAELFEETG